MKACAGVLALLLSSCGYHVAGRGDLIPKTVHTVAVRPFANASIRYKLTDELPEAIAREFITRTRYRVVSNPDTADAIVNGTVLNFTQELAVADPVTNQSSVMIVHVYLKVDLTERATGKVLFSRPNMEVRERYQIVVPPAAQGQAQFDQRNYFEETDDALKRAATETAQQVVSAILENF